MMARRVMAASRRLWTPREMATALWLDAADATTITKDGSNRVSQWANKNGSTRHATQSTGSAQPLWVANTVNGLPIIRFNGTSNYLDAHGGGSFISGAVFIVFDYERVADSRKWFAFSESNSLKLSWLGQGNFNTLHWDFGIDLYGGYSSDKLSNTSGVAIHGIVFAANASGQAYANGRTSGSSLNLTGRYVNDTQLRIGARAWTISGFTKADYCEIVFVKSALDTTTRQKLEGYLAHKWGLATTLSADHPYKSRPPRV